MPKTISKVKDDSLKSSINQPYSGLLRVSLYIYLYFADILLFKNCICFFSVLQKYIEIKPTIHQNALAKVKPGYF